MILYQLQVKIPTIGLNIVMLHLIRSLEKYIKKYAKTFLKTKNSCN